MSEHAVTLHNAQEGHAAMARLWAWAKPRLIAGQRLRLTVKEEKHSPAQRKKLEAMLGEISEQKEWAGQRWNPETWKRLMTAAWMRARGERVLVVPSIDGHGVDVVFRRTSDLSKEEMSDLIEYTLFWCAQEGVQLSQ